MSKIPQQLQYTKTHEWVKKEGDNLIFGITDHAQAMLGDVVYVDLPAVEMSFDGGQECAVIESVKAAADIYCPMPAEIIEVNQSVIEHPQLINQDPYGEGWLLRVHPFDEPKEHLLNAEEYNKIVAAEAH
jgi:glycine cleavage system H protein